MTKNDHINLLKLCVGAESIADLEAWIARRAAEQGKGARHAHVTRMWPRQEARLLAGGSLYWVIKGQVQCRQKVIGLEEVTGADGVRRCAILLDPEVIRTASAQRRPFQGWRYLKPEDAPPDLPKGRETETALPPQLEQALSDIGLR